jgi:hypothetical protein
MDGCVHARMHGWMDVDGCIDAWMDDVASSDWLATIRCRVVSFGIHQSLYIDQ